MPHHNQLTGTDLHEPKGVATAAVNTTYVADGAGSGSWTAYNTYRTTTIIKTSDTSRSSTTTFAADPTLTFALAANSQYKIRFVVFIQATTNGDFKIRCSSATGATNKGFIWFRNGTGTGINGEILLFSGSSGTSIDGGSASQTSFECQGEVVIFTSGTAGTFSIDWAQNASHADNTTVRSGSYIEYQKIS